MILALVFMVLITLTVTIICLESWISLWSEENSLLSHPYESGFIKKTILQIERMQIKEELQDYHFPNNLTKIEDLVPDSGGNPQKALV